MSHLVKICGLTDPENILEIIQVKPDWIGLIFYPGSSRYVAQPERLAFLNTIPERPSVVAVFVNPDMNEINHLTTILRIDIFQLHGSETPEFCGELRGMGFKVIKSFGLHKEFDFSLTEPYRCKADYFLFDTRSRKLGGSGEQFNWDLLKEYNGDTPFLLSGGISPDTRLIPDHRRLLGADLNSRFESAPGIKDLRLLQKFINHFRND